MKGTQRKKQILTAALKAFAEHGYERTSIAVICEKAGIARPTLYQYFKESKPTKNASRPVDVIITGRRMHFRKITLQWLDEAGVAYGSLILFPNKVKKTNRSLAEFKAYWINFLGVEIFFEDDMRIVEYLRENCQNTEIIFVEENAINFNISDTF